MTTALPFRSSLPVSPTQRGREAPMEVDPASSSASGLRSADDHWLSRLEGRQHGGDYQALFAMDWDASMPTKEAEMEPTSTSVNSESPTDPVVEQMKIDSTTMKVGRSASSRRRTKMMERSSTPVSAWWSTWEGLVSRLYVLPFVLYNWIHLVYHVMVWSSLAYLLFQLLWALYRDYCMKFEHFRTEIILQNTACAKQYTENRCEPPQRVPAMEQTCNDWERCMLRDPEAIASTKISASVLAELLESFVQQISYKTMLFMVVLMASTLCLKWLLGQLMPAAPSAAGSGLPSSPSRSLPPTPHPRDWLAPYQPSHFGSSGFERTPRHSRSRTPTRFKTYRSHSESFKTIEDDDDDEIHSGLLQWKEEREE